MTTRSQRKRTIIQVQPVKPQKCRLCPGNPSKATCACPKSGGRRKKTTTTQPEIAQPISNGSNNSEPSLAADNSIDAHQEPAQPPQLEAQISPSSPAPEASGPNTLLDSTVVQSLVARNSAPLATGNHVLEEKQNHHSKFKGKVLKLRPAQKLERLLMHCAQMERLSLETDSYTLVLSQQASGSSAVVHFSSAQLHREAMDDVTDLINQFQDLMMNLAKKEAEAAQKSVEDAETALKLRDAELAASNVLNADLWKELEELRAQASLGS
ncbi:hypothetical protein NP233_g335 [Leucocoprinus birnbaumii]|uniref:Uncharacterized protein n=1 Tax=Leucocoprinus birnbaumii TaxID=56174 RepID=A0AAD5W355_9AGAR|nr:hypothetical protein NP233_g335 [Leucocoprinus birnbaumii]